MTTNKTVFFLIGILLIVLGSSMLAPYSVQVLYGENSHSFISSSFVTIFIGILFVLGNLEKEFKTKDVFMVQIKENDFEIRFSGAELWVFSLSKEKTEKIFNLLDID